MTFFDISIIFVPIDLKLVLITTRVDAKFLDQELIVVGKNFLNVVRADIEMLSLIYEFAKDVVGLLVGWEVFYCSWIETFVLAFS